MGHTTPAGAGSPALRHLRSALVATTAAVLVAGLGGVARAAALDDMIDELVAGVSAAELDAHIQALSFPRATPSDQATASAYIRTELESWGYTVTVDPVQSSENLIVRLEGTTDPDKAFLIGAHFDTVPNAPGADDNASGVAALLEIARNLADYEPGKSIVFAFFALEEVGKIGSTQYAQNAAANGDALEGVVIFDMISYTCSIPGCQFAYVDIPPCMDVENEGIDLGDYIAVADTDLSSGVAALFVARAVQHVPGLGTNRYFVDPSCIGQAAYRRSDHASFWDEGYPAVLLSDLADGRNPNYHLPSDTPDTLDQTLMRRVAQATLATAVAATAVDCIDADGDGYGVGPLCLGDDCDDTDGGIRPGVSDPCDGVDDDCDGATDEDHVPLPTRCGLGACAGAAGAIDCVDGQPVDTCDPLLGSTAQDADCNGLDDDCDGETDEDFTPTPTVCGLGACAGNTGAETCVAEPRTLFGSNRDAEIWSLEPESAMHATAGALLFASQAIEQDPDTGEVYYFENFDADEFAVWDPQTGVNTVIRQYVPAPGIFPKWLAMAPDGTLYMVDNVDGLYRVDKQDGDLTALGTIQGMATGGQGRTGDFAFAQDGTLYGASYRALYAIDLVTLQAQLLFDNMLSWPKLDVWSGLAACDGLLYASDIRQTGPSSGDSTIYAIDPQTGSVMPLWTLDTYLNDLTSCPADGRGDAAPVDSCDPLAGAAPDDADCDGVDDDCDGTDDEDYVGAPTVCSPNGCSSTGAWACVDGFEVDGCPLTPPVCNVSGSVTYYRDAAAGGSEPAAKAVPAVGIDADDPALLDGVADAVTGSTGSFDLPSQAGKLYVRTLAKLGDSRIADENGAITALDADAAAQASVGLRTLTANQALAADVTGDGQVTALDAARIARYSIGTLDHFGVAVAQGSDWAFLRCDLYADGENQTCGEPLFVHDPLQSPADDVFYAVLYGDVTGDWQPAQRQAAGAASTSASRAPTCAAPPEP